jgi:large subunit ribosomal protein L25
MNTIELQGQLRTELGKKAANLLRKEDKVPCVLYGGKENISFAVDRMALKDVVYTDKFHTVNIVVDGKTYNAILKDVDLHPINERPLHVDFQELVPNTPVKVQIPVKLTGFAKGVKNGGKLELSLRTLAVKATPEQLVSEIELDVTPIGLGKSLKVRDLKTDLEVMNPGGIPIAKVIIPRAMRSAASKAEGGVISEDDEETEETAESTEA